MNQLLARLPTSFLELGPFGVRWWQWIGVILVVIAAGLLGLLLSRGARAALRWACAHTRTDIDDLILERLQSPITLACTLIVATVLVPLLEFQAATLASILRVFRAGFAALFFWSLWRSIDVGRTLANRTWWARSSPSSRSLVPLGARVSKVLVLGLALVATLSMLGYPVTSLIAGLGIGGLAVALAAQKTVENLFGAFSIGVDQPFREGDFVRVDDFVGTVEAIGLRSTRFRTLDRTVVTLPNGRLADMRLESFTARDRLRFAAVIGLVYETTGAQMRVVLSGFETALRAEQKIWPDAVVVRFSELASSSLNIEVMAWFRTSDWGEFQAIRQNVLLKFMDVVERAGSSFAFPTTTVHLAHTTGGPACATAPDVSHEAELTDAR
ncbi:MAG TPA: mechanosensitive ion channel family protein [Gemmatimonadaceae bacterium]|jgi:MscS family membrane protein